jgi:hypothetical protein
MRRFCSVILGYLIVLALSASTWAASEQAVKQRSKNALSEYSPSETFLSGNFVADEDEPAYIFGKLKDFVKSRSCSTAWLIEEGEKKRVEARDQQSGPIEYTLYLEEDCPGKVAYFIFVDRSQANIDQWMQWRQKFHGKSKTEPHYARAKAGLEQAAQNGFLVDSELRFVEVNGDLTLKKPEAILIEELKFQPIYDVKQGKAVSR